MTVFQSTTKLELNYFVFETFRTEYWLHCICHDWLHLTRLTALDTTDCTWHDWLHLPRLTALATTDCTWHDWLHLTWLTVLDMTDCTWHVITIDKERAMQVQDHAWSPRNAISTSNRMFYCLKCSFTALSFQWLWLENTSRVKHAYVIKITYKLCHEIWLETGVS